MSTNLIFLLQGFDRIEQMRSASFSRFKQTHACLKAYCLLRSHKFLLGLFNGDR
jgi:hypothetical protein